MQEFSKVRNDIYGGEGIQIFSAHALVKGQQGHIATEFSIEHDGNLLYMSCAALLC